MNNPLMTLVCECPDMRPNPLVVLATSFKNKECMPFVLFGQSKMTLKACRMRSTQVACSEKPHLLKRFKPTANLQHEHLLATPLKQLFKLPST